MTAVATTARSPGRSALLRLVPLLLAVSLPAWGLGAMLLWSATRISGTEACASCGVERASDRYLFLWVHSEPGRGPGATRSGSSCSGHDWRRVGCWFTGSGVACHLGGEF